MEQRNIRARIHSARNKEDRGEYMTIAYLTYFENFKATNTAADNCKIATINFERFKFKQSC